MTLAAALSGELALSEFGMENVFQVRRKIKEWIIYSFDKAPHRGHKLQGNKIFILVDTHRYYHVLV